MIHLPHARLAHSEWPRWPRRSARLRLTALYSGLFLVCGAALVAVTYVLFERATNIKQSQSFPEGTLKDVVPTLPSKSLGLKALGEEVTRASDRHQLLVNSGIALAIVAAIAVVLGWFVAGRVLRPVRTITATARRISATDLHQRLHLDGADEEFRQLGETLDDLFARLEASFEAQRHFVANASHELRTPLTRERTLLQVALGDPSTPPVWQSTGQELLASNHDQERLIEALLALASSQSGIDRSEMIDLSAICDNALQRCHLDTDQLGLRIDTDTRSALLAGEPRLIERLVANLLDNAFQHNIRGGRIRISTSTTDGKAVIAVTNTGPFIPSDDVKRLFQPFQRLNPRRARTNGHGLGLSIVQAIATAHGADITAHPPADGGLAVQVTFPRPPDRHPGSRRIPRVSPVGVRGEVRSPLAQPQPQVSPAVSPLLTSSPSDGSPRLRRANPSAVVTD